MITVASKSPPKPPAAKPKFQPKKSPEITAPTPRAQSDHTRAYRRRPRFSEVLWLDLLVGNPHAIPSPFGLHGA